MNNYSIERCKGVYHYLSSFGYDVSLTEIVEYVREGRGAFNLYLNAPQEDNEEAIKELSETYVIFKHGTWLPL